MKEFFVIFALLAACFLLGVLGGPLLRWPGVVSQRRPGWVVAVKGDRIVFNPELSADEAAQKIIASAQAQVLKGCTKDETKAKAQAKPGK